MNDRSNKPKSPSDQYSYYLYSSVKSYGSSPSFIHHAEVPDSGFTSVYAVTLDTAKAIIAEGTSKGFKGVVWNERLWIDVDSYPAADATEARLRELGLDYVAYDSGSKGAHFGILRTATPSHRLPARDRQWVAQNVPQADLSIYTHLHPFRLVGTKHETTGRTKEFVSSNPGKALVLPPLQETKYVVGEGGSQKSVFDCFRVMANTVPAFNGERHSTLVKLTYALRDDAKVDELTAMWWVSEANKMFEEPKTDEEVQKIVRSIFRG